MDRATSDQLFTAMTRPLMFAGVPYPLLIINVIVMAEVFLIFHSLLALLVGVIIHACGWIVCLREPRFIDLWLTKVRRCQRVPNHKVWRCNSYRP